MAALRSLPVLSATDDQPIEPAREGGLESKLRQTPGQLEARLLRDVFGVSAVTAPFPGKAINEVVVQIEQLRKRGNISALGVSYETCQIWIVHSYSSLTVAR